MLRPGHQAATVSGMEMPDFPIAMLRVAPSGAVLGWNAALLRALPNVAVGGSVQSLLGLAEEELALAAGLEPPHPLPCCWTMTAAAAFAVPGRARG